jgi:glutaminase
VTQNSYCIEELDHRVSQTYMFTIIMYSHVGEYAGDVGAIAAKSTVSGTGNRTYNISEM